MFWIIIFLLILILAYQSDDARGYPKKKTQFFRVGLIIVLSLISAIGSPTGQDHQWYSIIYRDNSFANLFDFSSYEHYEPGYLLFNGICRKLNIPEGSFFLIISLFINSITINYIYRYRYPVVNVCLIFLGGFLIQQGNIVRQIIASSIFLFSVQYLVEKRIRKYILCIVIAALFHYTSLFFLVLSPLCLNDIEKHGKTLKLIMLSILGISTLIALGYVSLPMADLIQMASYYEDYMDSEEGIGMKLSPIRIFFYDFITLILILFSNRQYYKHISIVVLYAFVMNVSVIIPNLARMVSYFDIISTTLLIHCLGENVLNLRIKKFTPIILIVLSLFILTAFLAQFIFADEVLLCSKTYTLKDFI